MPIAWSGNILILACIWARIPHVTTASETTADGSVTTTGCAQCEGDPKDILDSTTTSQLPVSIPKDFENDVLEAWDGPKYISENFPYYVSGFDYDGRPIFVFELGKYNYAAAIAKYGEEMEREFLRYADQGLLNAHKLAAKIERTDEGVGEYAFIIDFDGFSLEHVGTTAAMKLCMQVLTKFGKAYRELGYGFLINTNHLVTTIMDASRPLLGRFLERVETFGSRKELWLPKLLRKFPRDQLPPWYGGEKDFRPAFVFG